MTGLPDDDQPLLAMRAEKKGKGGTGVTATRGRYRGYGPGIKERAELLDLWDVLSPEARSIVLRTARTVAKAETLASKYRPPANARPKAGKDEQT